MIKISYYLGTTRKLHHAIGEKFIEHKLMGSKIFQIELIDQRFEIGGATRRRQIVTNI